MKKNTRRISLAVLIIATITAFSIFATQNLSSKNNTPIDNSKNKTTSTQQNLNQSTKPLEQTPEFIALLKPQLNDIILGDKNAPITIIEYASLSCPHCATFYQEAFIKLKKEYIDTKKAKFIYRDFPLNQPALSAAMIALCQVQNKDKDATKYYNFIKVLFKSQDSWAFSDDFINKLTNIAKLNGIDNKKFQKCINSAELQQQILEVRLKAAKILQISSTPTFFVDNTIVHGYHKYDAIKNLIDQKLLSITVNSP